jgi:hypothetical protein
MRSMRVGLLVACLIAGQTLAQIEGWVAGLGLVVGDEIDLFEEVHATGHEAVPFTAPEGDDRLDFINRDRLHGRLVSASGETKRLTWKHAAALEEIQFGTDSLAQIRFAKRRAERPGAFDSLVQFTNGDVMPATIVGMDADTVQVDTWFAGRVRINRRMVTSIQPNRSISDALFEGPNNLEEWTLYPHGGSRPQWRFEEGTLHAVQTYPAGRIIEGLPDRYQVRFVAAWRGMHPNFTFIMNTADVQQNREAYNLAIQGPSLSLMRATRNTGSRNIGSTVNYAGFDGSSNQRSASFTMLVDKLARSFTLLIDGRVVGQWTDTAEFAGQGNGIAFRSPSQGDLAVSKISVSPWDGRVPGDSGRDTGVVKDDQVRFMNDDRFSGQVISIENAVMKFKTSYATLDVPVARVAEITLASETAERARRNRDDVRAVFLEYGILTITLDRLESDVLHGESENFGKIALPLGIMKMLELNLYREAQP